MAKASMKKVKERGSSDELEILREIINSDPYLLERVLAKIREQRGSVNQGLAEMVSEKTGAKKAEERRKGSGT